ncbi:MAG: LuxR family transcriptional regulator [Mesorhizobium sp.]|uniref:LuxR family transcriptional regulator n=1 Tax=Mesorhizobium sp. TaxID=1871066 RepID=UPI001212FE4A|nr:LuxR family transcriptional regulator [Mesorhizobium sp.]TIL22101.1 MAG: LuxR family transcriptional regulator [Mesorhizobium sp.]TIQ41645.1 MAG: LuxR family transcriptional regulator [Mesorhizobium sp.]TIW62004.1 MAG: LuxR family transcriptional regulator [Mesorhizobium sp.]TIW69526.1 MAG: LuxR family transcriptional regulator [Mesorhizobium sp.]TJW31406.1 MAG: LuxR family transcriptional regulator [Mesorhizobium sp.]
MELPRIAVELGLFLDTTADIAESEQLFELLSEFAQNFDCPWIAYGPLAADQMVLKPARRDTAIMWNYPVEWQERYSKMDYARIDPIIKKGRKKVGAFRWSEVYKEVSTTENERRVLDEAATFGLRYGVTVPLHGPGDSFAFMSFAQSSDCEFQDRTITHLQFAAIQFHLRVAKLSNEVAPRQAHDLSPKEIECLLWVARGKSSGEIGTILGRSGNTIDFHLKNVMRKLDTTSRTVAAIKAVKLGIIEP